MVDAPLALSHYLAGAQNSRHAVAVSQCELDLNIDPPGSFSRNPARPQPVILAGAHHVTDLIRRAIIIISNTNKLSNFYFTVQNLIIVSPKSNNCNKCFISC